MNEQAKRALNYDQASAVPVRCRGQRIEFCLITSSGKQRWCFPKGIIDPGETPLETALKEAEEEAGVTGKIQHPPLGSYEYRKWGRSLSVLVMLMKVHEAWDAWEESGLRQRRWVTIDQAVQLLDQRRGLDRFALAAARRLDVPIVENSQRQKP